MLNLLLSDVTVPLCLHCTLLLDLIYDCCTVYVRVYSELAQHRYGHYDDLDVAFLVQLKR